MNTRFRRITLSLTLVLFATGSRAAAQDYQTHWKRAQKAMEAMKLEEAKRALRSALESLGSPPKSLEKAERIHALLSSVCEGTSQVAEALTHQEERLRLMERRLGAKHPDLMPALESAARLNRKLGRIPAALKQLERARALAEELPPKSRAPALERIYSELVRCRELAGDFDGLFEPLEAWIALIRQQRGPDHPDLVYPLTLQARALATLKRFEESVPVYKEWIRLQRLVWKGDHAGLARPLELLSFALLQLDRLDEASKVCDEWRGLLDRVMKDHPEIPRVLARRADIAEKRGRTDEVVKYLAEAVQRSQNNTAWRGSRVGVLYRRLARAQRRAGDAKSGYSSAEQAVKKLESAVGPRDPDTLLAVIEQARCAAALGKTPQAIGLLRRLIRRWESWVGKNHPVLVRPLKMLGQLLIQSGAEAKGREALERAAHIEGSIKKPSQT